MGEFVHIRHLPFTLSLLPQFLGFAVGGGFFPQGNGLLIIDSVDCMGSENTIVNCTIQAPSFCSHFADAGVICLGGICLTLPLALV